MKVAIFTDTYAPEINGVALTTERLVKYFKDNDIEYMVLAPNVGEKCEDSNIIRCKSMKFILYPECRLSVPIYPYIVKAMGDFKPDIIHVMTPINIGLCGIKYAKEYNIPLVSHYHTNFGQYLNYYNFKLIEDLSWKYFRWFHGKCDRNYCPSQSSYELLENHGIGNFEVVNNGIDIDVFSPKYRDINFRERNGFDHKLAILYVGRFAAEKDMDVFIDTAKMLNEKYEDKIHFVMVGDGPMKKDIVKSDFKNVTFTGFLQGEELSKVYASSDIFLFPSSTETYGNVILEAMASGLPTVACKKGGIFENVIDGYNGFLCGEKDTEDFYKAVEKLILNEDLRKAFAKNGLRHAKGKSWDRIFDKLMESYEEVIEECEVRERKIIST
jgi:glycosyltransferase involved in cell wall biosynthesis